MKFLTLINIFIFTSIIGSVNSLAESSSEALIIETRGNVSVVKAGLQKTIPAFTGLVLVGGDKIQTGPDGHAIILFSNSSRIDLFANSRLQIQTKQGAKQDGKSSTLGKLWSSIKSKFTDTSETGAQAGRVGTLRGPENEKPPENEDILLEDSEALAEDLALIEKEKLSIKTTKIMKAIVYEEYGQYQSAEKIYLDLIKKEPNDKITYTMLIDLYLKLDLYKHASESQIKKNRAE